ncbi:MAG TPA: DNA alkylation repair protein [Ignavibacteriaceae bacterium]|nr:DNA alkylation repair protein [Ignavibacteriaceae bacterium]
MSAIELKQYLKSKANVNDAINLQRFFKTGPGEYGEGDIFHGIKIPILREATKKFMNLSLADIQEVLHSKYHEERMISLFLLINKFKKAEPKEKKTIYNMYLKNTKYINNWDLVDLSSHHIVGAYLFDKEKDILYKMAASKDLWKKRIAIISTFYFLRRGDFVPTFKIAEMLLNDKHDLIHKGVGWMLREVGNRDMGAEEEFLLCFYKQMPRTMLRYAIEKFPENKRQAYLKGRM